MTKSDQAPKPLLTIPEAAGALSLGRSTIYELIQKGQLPVVHIGRAVRLRLSDIEQWVKEQAD